MLGIEFCEIEEELEGLCQSVWVKGWEGISVQGPVDS